MTRARKDQDEKELEKLAKKLLSTPPKPREGSKMSKKRKSPPRPKKTDRKR